jgi:hypothetical protein
MIARHEPRRRSGKERWRFYPSLRIPFSSAYTVGTPPRYLSSLAVVVGL